MRAFTVATLVLASAAVSAQSPTQDAPQRAPGVERVAATAVVLDIVVRDSRGRPVVDLKSEDFEIYEDGVLQRLGSFRPPIAAGDAARPAAAPATPAAAATAAADAPSRPAAEPTMMAFLFDQLTIESRQLALDAVRRYLGQHKETPNYIALYDIDWGLVPLVPFTRDAEAVRKGLAKVTATRAGRADAGRVSSMATPTEAGLVNGRPGSTDAFTMDEALRNRGFVVPGGPDGGMPNRYLAASQAFNELMQDPTASIAVSATSALVTALSTSPGRKSIVLFSEGLPINRMNDARFYSTIDQANRANVAVYAVDAVGLRAEDDILNVSRAAARVSEDGDGNLRAANVTDMARAMPDVGLGILANETGGFLVAATNDLYRTFPRLDEDLRSYYALTYAPPRTEADYKFHKVVVKVKRPGLTVRNRSGYTSLPVSTRSMPVVAYEAPALAKLESTPVPNDLPIHSRALVFPVSPQQARVPVLVSVPTSALEYGRDEAAETFAAEATVLIRVRDAAGQVVHKASEQYSLSGKLRGIEQSRAGELLFYRQALLAPGLYTLEAVVHDGRSDKASVRVSSLEVPAAAEATPRLGTPFIIRRAERVEGEAKDESNPLYFGDVLIQPNLGQPLSKARDKDLTFGFTAYDGHGGPVEASLELLRSGQTVANVPLPLSAADGKGRINQISKLPLEPLAPGAYELRVTVQAGQKRVTRGVHFAVAGP